jgi:hypothetical protein
MVSTTRICNLDDLDSGVAHSHHDSSLEGPVVIGPGGMYTSLRVQQVTDKAPFGAAVGKFEGGAAPSRLSPDVVARMPSNAPVNPDLCHEA